MHVPAPLRDRLLLSCTIGFVGCGGPATMEPVPGAPPIAVNEPDARDTPEAPEPPPRVRVLWRDAVPKERVLGDLPAPLVRMTHHVLTLIGVDRKSEHAYLVRSPLGSEDWFEIVDVPLSEETPARPPRERWIGARGVKYGDFAAFGGDATQNLLRYAAIVEETGPFVTRRKDGSSPEVAVSSEALLFQGQHDDMFLSDRKGGHSHKVTAARAAYNPQFSADGKAFAFTGCHSVPPVPGKTHQCEYHLYISGPADRTPARIAKVIDPEPPVFSADGRYVYTVSRDANYEAEPRDRGGCLYRVDVAQPHTATELWCTDKHRGLAFLLDPEGKTAVVTGTRLGAQDYALDVEWLDLPDGKARGRVSIPYGSSLGALAKGGLYATGARQGFAYADLATGKVVVLKENDRVFTLLSHHFADDDSVYATRQIAGRVPTEEIVAIDLRASLETPE